MKGENTGNLDDAGTTVQLTGEGVITAKAVATSAGEKIQNPNKSPQVTTTYKYLYGYVAGALVYTEKSGISSNYYENGYSLGKSPYTDHENYTAVTSAPDISVPTLANAATDTVGTNMTTDADGYLDFKN